MPGGLRARPWLKQNENMFSSLRVREFRIYWVSMFVSLIGSWVQTMAQSWLVFRLTHSAFLMGLTGFLSYLPVSFFALAAGVYVDRSVKRNLLLVTQSCFTILALVLALLVWTGTVRIWHVIVIATINGFVLSFDSPTRQAMVVELVGRQHLMNAIALNSAAFNSARIIGPAVAGLLIALIGTSGCFFVNAISYLPVLAALALIKPRPPVVRGNQTSVYSDIRESILLVKDNRFLLFLLALVALVSTFGVSYVVLMPIFAQEVLRSGAMGLAMLMSSSGAGALIGVLNVARLKNAHVRFRLLHISVIVFFLSAMVFSVSRNMLISCALLVLAGAGIAGSMALVNSMIQLSIPDGHRGRIMGLFMMMFMGFIPFGNLLFGAFAQAFGVQEVVFFAALMSMLVYWPFSRKFLSDRRTFEERACL
jgi:MFS family permease